MPLKRVYGDGNCLYYSVTIALLSHHLGHPARFKRACDRLFQQPTAPLDYGAIDGWVKYELAQMPVAFAPGSQLGTLVLERLKPRVLSYIDSQRAYFVGTAHDMFAYATDAELDAHLAIQGKADAYAELTEVVALSYMVECNITVLPADLEAEPPRTAVSIARMVGAKDLVVQHSGVTTAFPHFDAIVPANAFSQQIVVPPTAGAGGPDISRGAEAIFDDTDGSDTSDGEFSGFELDQEVALEAWLSFKVTNTCRTLLKKYAGYEVDERVLQSCYILYQLGLQAYHHKAVRREYRSEKRVELRSRVSLLCSIEERINRMEQLIKKVFSNALSIAVNARGCEAMLKAFFDENAEEIKALAGALVAEPRTMLRTKRLAKRGVLVPRMEELRLNFISRVKFMRWGRVESAKPCPPKSDKRKWLNDLLKQGLDIVLARLMKQAKDSGCEENLQGVLDSLNEMDEGDLSVIEVAIREALTLYAEELEADPEVELADVEVKAFLDESWESSLREVAFAQERVDTPEKNQLMWLALEANGFDSALWGYAEPFVEVTRERRKALVLSRLSRDCIASALVESFNSSGFYSIERHELARRSRLALTPACAHLAALHLVQRSQLHTVRNVEDEGDGLGDDTRFGWIAKNGCEKHVVAERMEVTCAGSQSDVVKQVGAYEGKGRGSEERGQSVFVKINSLMKADCLNCEDSEVARLLLRLHRGEEINLAFITDEGKRKATFSTLANILQLLLGTEVRRNLASIPSQLMLLHLICDGRLTWAEALTGKSAARFRGGRMPMSMEDAVSAARRIQFEFSRESAEATYQYAGVKASGGDAGSRRVAELMLRQHQLLNTWRLDTVAWLGGLTQLIERHYKLAAVRAEPVTKRVRVK